MSGYIAARVDGFRRDWDKYVHFSTPVELTLSQSQVCNNVGVTSYFYYKKKKEHTTILAVL